MNESVEVFGRACEISTEIINENGDGHPVEYMIISSSWYLLHPRATFFYIFLLKASPFRAGRRSAVLRYGNFAPLDASFVLDWVENGDLGVSGGFPSRGRVGPFNY
ncbi:hypothetical protein [Thermococcus eurythermalis]|uniref:hypothetical protein n=1 Tax=Thermococcus eurythermalis TaxID=1505907 RepID=UPI0011855590|nr:hypothetical protein [Thermococcus eurythermalis]